MKRLPILYLILAMLVLVSVVPLLIYSSKVIGINREALETNEKELQNSITRSVADGIDLYESSVSQLLKTFLGTLTPPGQPVPASGATQVSKALQDFVSSNPNILYVTLLNEQAHGWKAGAYDADSDPFLLKALERAFTAAQQDRALQSEPVLVQRGGQNVPVMVLSLPIRSGEQFHGMLASVIDLQPMVERLQDYSIRELKLFVVNDAGHLMLDPDLAHRTIGEDLSRIPIVANFLAWKGQAQARETSSYDVWEGSQRIPMLGTYCSVPGLHWAVIAQKPQAVAYISVHEMERTTKLWGAALLLISLLVAYYSALRITTPIHVLTDSSRAIARGDFSQRIKLQSRTEIGELAATFNQMTGELERYVDQLKTAAEENRELFLSSVRMIAAAVDEKDPYTHGHSERVTRYSMAIAYELGLSEEDIYRVKIAGLLHDVGKIGIEDRVLKKPGPLTPEEFEIMKTHVTRGANILRPIEKLHPMIPGVELHHESIDGRGYPYGLKAETIPLLARMISVADTFDAMTTDRPYQKGMVFEVALQYIKSQAGRKYDPQCVDAFHRAFDSGRLQADTERAMAVV
jgi:putative nucleotidyltransferase with HDIG domain